jgi:hypothetical protein
MVLTFYLISFHAIVIYNVHCHKIDMYIRVITKLSNSEKSYKGKVKLISIQTDKISQQPENCENRNDPDLVQAFLKKCYINQFPQLQDSYNVKNIFLSMCDVKLFLTFASLGLVLL